MKRFFLIIAILLSLLVMGFYLGPTFPRPSLVDINYDIKLPDVQGISTYLINKEAKFKTKPGCESQIVWADSIGQKTAYSILYLHGFGACHWEGAPVHQALADSLGANLYLHRVDAHGLQTEEAMLDYKSKAVLEDTYEALKIAEQLGEKVLVLAMSTGATYALYHAANVELPAVKAMFLYSPNIRVADPRSSLLIGPWGTQIASIILGGKYRSWEPPVDAKPYFYAKQRIEGTQEMLVLLEETMNAETFEKVKLPTLVGYFKTPTAIDEVISVDAVENMFESLGTAPTKKELKAYGKGVNHNLLNPVFSPTGEEVTTDILNFIENKQI